MESYQRIYAKLLDAAGIANGRITGNGHTWNAVKIDGKWCQMDLTWNDANDNWYGDLDQRHLYFGLTDELMAIAHSDHTANYKAEGYAYRSTDLSNDYFVRNGKADEWASAYVERIQQHLDAKEASFSIDANNGSFPPSISGIQNAIIAYATNQREWCTTDGTVTLTTTSNVTTVSSYEWSAKFDFTAEYPAQPKPDSSTQITDHSAVYDCTFYLAHNADVASAYGGDESATFRHFQKYGMAEGRRGCASFDPKEYRTRYSDVAAACGDDWPRYYARYIKYGKVEGRSQIQIDPLVEGNRVAVATGLPKAGHAGLHQQPLTLVVVVGCHLVRQRRTRAHDAHPFCQDENARSCRDFAQVTGIIDDSGRAIQA